MSASCWLDRKKNVGVEVFSDGTCSALFDDLTKKTVDLEEPKNFVKPGRCQQHNKCLSFLILFSFKESFSQNYSIQFFQN